jgi:hypothetical protein
MDLINDDLERVAETVVAIRQNVLGVTQELRDSDVLLDDVAERVDNATGILQLNLATIGRLRQGQCSLLPMTAVAAALILILLLLWR